MQANERDELNIRANSSTDYVVAGIFGFLSSGPIGLGLSLLSLKLLAQASGQKQKWILWVIIGGIATPIINFAQIAVGMAIVSGLSNMNRPAQIAERIVPQPTPVVVEAETREPIVTSTPTVSESYDYTPTGTAPNYERYSGVTQNRSKDSAIVSKSGDTFIYGMTAYLSPGSYTYSTESYSKQITGEIEITSVAGQKAIGTFTDRMADGSQACQGQFEINQLSSVSTPLFNAVWRVNGAQPGSRCELIGKSFELKNMQLR